MRTRACGTISELDGETLDMFRRNAEAEDGLFIEGATFADGAALAWVNCWLADGADHEWAILSIAAT